MGDIEGIRHVSTQFNYKEEYILKHRIIAAAIMLLTALLLSACSDSIRSESKNNEEVREDEEPEQTKSAGQDKPVASIDTHKRLEGWTITVYAEEDRVFQYSGTIELGRPREIIVRVEEETNE